MKTQQTALESQNETKKQNSQEFEDLLEEKAEAAPVDRKGKFSVRLTGAFALTALMTAFIAVIMLALVWNQSFEEYRRDNMVQTAHIVSDQASMSFIRYGRWVPSDLSGVWQLSETNSIGICIVDSDSRVLLDTTNQVLEYDPTQKVLSPSVLKEAQSFSDCIQGNGYLNESSLSELERSRRVRVPIVVNGQVVGAVHIWAYGTDSLLTNSDFAFRAATYRAVGLAAVVAVILASLGGYVFAHGLVVPINKITATARAIRQGDTSARTNMEAIDEIGELGKTFDEMAAAVEKDREMERRLTSDVAHELRTPLMAIQATVEAMADGVFLADGERLHTVSNETVRLSRLVDAILELTRLERGSTPFVSEKVDLSQLVAETALTHEALFDSCEIELKSQTISGVYVLGDPDRLRQVIANLLSNAARYTPSGGTVTLSLCSENDTACFKVSDTGIGINPEDVNKVFSRFWRADKARNRSHGGLGIGLAVVKEIVDRLNGTVVASSNETGGATFTVCLPTYKDPQADSKKSNNGKNNNGKTKTKRRKA